MLTKYTLWNATQLFQAQPLCNPQTLRASPKLFLQPGHATLGALLQELVFEHKETVTNPRQAPQIRAAQHESLHDLPAPRLKPLISQAPWNEHTLWDAIAGPRQVWSIYCPIHALKLKGGIKLCGTACSCVSSAVQLVRELVSIITQNINPNAVSAALLSFPSGSVACSIVTVSREVPAGNGQAHSQASQPLAPSHLEM